MQRIVRRLKLKIACLSANALIISYHLFLTPSPLRFFRNVFSRERLKLWFLVTFNIIIGYIFPENFIEIPQVVQKIWRISPSIFTIPGHKSLKKSKMKLRSVSNLAWKLLSLQMVAYLLVCSNLPDSYKSFVRFLIFRLSYFHKKVLQNWINSSFSKIFWRLPLFWSCYIRIVSLNNITSSIAAKALSFCRDFFDITILCHKYFKF